MSLIVTRGPEEAVPASPIGPQHTPSVTALSGGGYVVAWLTRPADNFVWSIACQRYDAVGQKVGAEETISVGGRLHGDQQLQIAPLANGGWVIQAEAGDTSYSGVYQQAFSSVGARLGSTVRVNATVNGSQAGAHMAPLADGGWIATWDTSLGDPAQNGVYQRRYDASGSAVGGEVRVDQGASLPGFAATASAGPNGSWIVAWSMATPQGRDLHTQAYDRFGQKMGEATTVSIEPGPLEDRYEGTLALRNGGWVRTWSAYASDGVELDVYQQRYRADGQKIGSIERVNAQVDWRQEALGTMSTPDGGWVTIWSSDDENGDAALLQQRYSANGDKMGAALRVDRTDTHHIPFGDLTLLPDGGWIVTWQIRQLNGQDAIYQQRFDALGEAVGPNIHIMDSTYSRHLNLTTTGLADSSWVTFFTSPNDDSDRDLLQRFFNVASTLTQAIDIGMGTAGSDDFTALPSSLGIHDTIDGRAGTDTIRLAEAGALDLTAPAFFAGIEALVGSDGADTITINQSRMTDLRSMIGGDGVDTLVTTGAGLLKLSQLETFSGIEVIQSAPNSHAFWEMKTGQIQSGMSLMGGAGFDRLQLKSGTYDFTGVTVAGIDLLSFEGGSSAIFDVKATALLSSSSLRASSLELRGDTFTPGELLRLFRIGFHSVVDANGQKSYKDPSATGIPNRQTVESNSLIKIFENIQIGIFEDARQITARVEFDSPRGDLKNILKGSYSPSSRVYSVTGSATEVQTALRALTFDPIDRLGPVGGTETTFFTLSITDGVKTNHEVGRTWVTSTVANLAPGEPVLDRTIVLENAKAGTLVGTLGANDPNSGDQASFTLVAGADRFELAANRLLVKAGAKIDFEAARFHDVRVKVTDSGGLTVEKTFRIDVVDILVEQIRGTGGKDTLKGGLGQDAFMFDARPTRSNVDKIESFVVKDDSLWLENSIYKGFGKKGSLSNPAALMKDAFFTGTKAGDAEDRIVYDRKSGKLFYDEDGTGAKAQVLIAQMQKGLRLTEKDFFVI